MGKKRVEGGKKTRRKGGRKWEKKETQKGERKGKKWARRDQRRKDKKGRRGGEKGELEGMHTVCSFLEYDLFARVYIREGTGLGNA